MILKTIIKCRSNERSKCQISKSVICCHTCLYIVQINYANVSLQYISAKISIKEIEKIQGLTFKRNVYVIQNGNSKLPFTPAPVDMIGIATRTTLGLLQEKINADVERIYYLTQRDEVGFNMIEIPDYFKADKAIEFDSVYINELLKVGLEMGQTGSFWHSLPPSER